jgi:hypothetical protein
VPRLGRTAEALGLDANPGGALPESSSIDCGNMRPQFSIQGAYFDTARFWSKPQRVAFPKPFTPLLLANRLWPYHIADTNITALHDATVQSGPMLQQITNSLTCDHVKRTAGRIQAPAF